MLWLDNNTEDVFYIDLTSFLSLRGLDINDLVEVTYMVKLKRNVCDSAAVVTKTLGDGVTVVTGSSRLQIQFDDTDFGTSALNTSSLFYTGLKIRTASMTDSLEVKLEDDRLTIRSSFFQDC